VSLSHRERGKLGAIAGRATQQESFEARLVCYAENPKRCEECRSSIPYIKRHDSIYCSSACSATANNRKRSLRIDRPCQSCGIQLRGKGAQRYCSVRCQQKLRMFEAVANGTAGSATMKRWLIHQHGERCMDPACAWDFEKRPIGVELDHKDGNAENNAPENVWLLCPNCHSTTPTYKNRNKGNGRAFRRERYRAGLSF